MHNWEYQSRWQDAIFVKIFGVELTGNVSFKQIFEGGEGNGYLG